MTSTFIALAIASTIPVLATALGGMIAERARATNIGMDGTMLIGALTALATADFTGKIWLALAAGILAGGLYALLLAFSTYVLGTDIIIGGIAWNLVATGLALLITSAVFHQPGTYAPNGVDVLPRVPLGPLAQIPIIGPALEGQSILLYFTIAVLVIVSFTMRRTRFGVWVRASGESEEAAEAAGIRPARVRTLALFLSGLTAGLGGAFLTISSVPVFNSQVTNGAGFIALAAIIFGTPTVPGTVLASTLFGFAVAASLQLQVTGFSPQLLQGVPYAATILALGLYGVREFRRRRYQTSDTHFQPVIAPQ